MTSVPELREGHPRTDPFPFSMSKMPTEDSASDRDHTLFGVFQLHGAKFLKNVRLGAHATVQKMKTFLRGYVGVQNTRITRQVSEIATLAHLGRKVMLAILNASRATSINLLTAGGTRLPARQRPTNRYQQPRARTAPIPQPQ